MSSAMASGVTQESCPRGSPGNRRVWPGSFEGLVLCRAKRPGEGASVRSGVSGMEIKMVLYLPRDAVSVPVSRQVLDSCLETLGVTPNTRADIALALSEACANVIQHAGPGEEYEVLVSAKDCQCPMEVVNTGPPDGARPVGL